MIRDSKRRKFMVKLRKMKKVWSAILLLTAAFFLAACGTAGDTGGSGDGQESADYVSITAEEAKGMMDAEQDYILLDVRTEEEFAEGHIPGAVLIPDYEIGERAQEMLPDKEQLIFVYCRSGNRSKKASAELAEMGYTNVKEFGGIIDWPYETEEGIII